ncbi:MAG: YebC/PmpR family DNA-binding transcriptional regulator [Candidatus Eremiobacteraeota bacterium]|nr:YebC/PmpR family DNA-binding transcriptional regulator [Candidatus Eremiobacteraeota bacterium]
MGRKWQNIKLGKGKLDQERGALFTKLSREITLAAKNGSPDPDANHRLKIAVDKARENNMPQDNIKRAIARGAGGTGEKEIEEIRYEGYGPHGVAVVIDAATDNRNRTAGELRFLFSKHGGSLGETGAVAWMFDPVGIVEVDSGGKSEDGLTECALVDGVVDLDYSDEQTLIYTEPVQLAHARELLSGAGLKITGAYLGVRAKQTVSPEGSQLNDALAFLDAVESNEDVQHVFSNLELSDAALEALA